MYNKVIEILNKAVVKKIKVYDMKSLTPLRQGIAAINYLKKEAENLGFKVRSFSSSSETTWFLIDLNDVVVHLFVGDERYRYNLDGMYGDNPIKVVE